jgi:hypothetical protein
MMVGANKIDIAYGLLSTSLFVNLGERCPPRNPIRYRGTRPHQTPQRDANPLGSHGRSRKLAEQRGDGFEFVLARRGQRAWSSGNEMPDDVGPWRGDT